MDPQQRRQTALFVVAVLLPSALLVALGLRLIWQESELAQTRQIEERQRLAGNLSEQLLVRLEGIMQEAIRADGAAGVGSSVGAPGAEADRGSSRTRVDPAVVLVGEVDDDRLLLPWDIDEGARAFERTVAESGFALAIQQAERAEFVDEDFGRAATLYQEALDEGYSTAQQAYARLLLARTLTKEGRDREALEHYRQLLPLRADPRDELGVPLSFYAVARVLENGTDYQEARECLREVVGMRPWLSPTALYMLQGLARTLAESAPDTDLRAEASGLAPTIDQRIGEVEQILALQAAFPTLLRSSRDLPPPPTAEESGVAGEQLWIPYGDEPWLVGLATSMVPERQLALVVRPGVVVTSLVSGTERYVGGSEPWLLSRRTEEGESLGPRLPGLRVAFPPLQEDPAGTPWSLQQSFYAVALLLGLSATLFGGYLFWRDVRRGIHMARMRSEFVSSVSHELKTPLTSIRMFAETLRLGRSKSRRMEEEYLDTIVDESVRLTRLLNNVLDFAKIEKGNRLYRKEPTAPAEVAHAAVRTMQEPLAQLGFALEVDIEDEAPDVCVDRDALEQAILNLLSNAMKYSGEARDIDLRVNEREGEILIQVSDRGVGITPKQQARIFEEFYRAPTTTNEHVPGTGLGLALVDHFVKAHAGHIGVQSTPGHGSTFSIHLPLHAPDSRNDAAPGATP